MICARLKWIALLFFLLQIWETHADFSCLCAYAVETPVYPAPKEQGKPIGYMYEFDCKPVYHKIPESGFQSIQMEKQVGYVVLDASREIQLCQGSVPAYDKVPLPSTVASTKTSEKLTTTSQSPTSPSNVTTTGMQVTTGTSSPIVYTASMTTGNTIVANSGSTTSSNTSVISTILTTKVDVRTSTATSQATVSSTPHLSTDVSTMSSAAPITNTTASSTTSKTSTTSSAAIKNTTTPSTTSKTSTTSSAAITNTTTPSTTSKTSTTSTAAITNTTTPSTTSTNSSTSAPAITNTTAPSTTSKTNLTSAPAMANATTQSTTSNNSSSSALALANTTTPSTTSNTTLTSVSAIANTTTPSTTYNSTLTSAPATANTTSQSTTSKTSSTSAPAMANTTTPSTTSDTYSTSAAAIANTTTPSTTSKTPLSSAANMATNSTLSSTPTFLTTTPPSTATSATTTTRSTTPTTSTPTSTVSTTTPSTTRTTAGTTPAPVLVSKCKVGWTLYKGSCYLFHTSGRATWNNANSVCKSYHSHLVAIETREEDMFVANELGQRIDSEIDGSSHTGVWVGGTDDDTEGKWVWHNGVTGHDTPISYEHWMHGEPDSGDGDHDEDCMCLIGDDNYTWQDYSCGKHMFYVCEMPPVTTTQSMSSASCPGGWVAHQTSCYYIHTGIREKWSTAVSSCLADQAHLAIIDTQNEQGFLQTVLHHLVDTAHNDDSDTGVWVAGTDSDKEGTWMWHNAVTGVDTQLASYVNWRPGQPDTGEHDHDEDCMCLVGDQGFAWEDYSCGEDMFYICEKDMPIDTQPGANKYLLSCPGGWTMYHESCYLFSHHDHLEWDDAGDECRHSNAYLVEIESQDEQSFLVNQYKHILGSGSDEGFWAAGTDAHHEGHWVWMNTLSNRETTAINSYANWRSGHSPNNGEDCLAMFADHNYQWEDHRCRNNLYHVCEKSAIRHVPTLIG